MRPMLVLLIMLLAALQGCGSLVHGTSQELEINTIPPGAKATIGTQTCVTPCKLTVKRASPNVQVEKDDYKKTVDLKKDFQYGASHFGNILWAEVGIIIDVATGSAWEIQPVNIQLDAADEEQKEPQQAKE